MLASSTPVPTQTNSLPTETPTWTPTVIPTSTTEPSATPTSTPQAGEDIKSNCLYQGNWSYSPVSVVVNTDRRGCLDLPVISGITLVNGKISLLQQSWRDKTTVMGITSPLTNNSSANFKFKTTGVSNSEIWIGIFPLGGDPAQNGLYLFARSNGNFDIKEFIDGREKFRVENKSLGSNPQTFTFNITGNRLEISAVDSGGILYRFTPAIQIPFDDPALFIGYRLYRGAFVDAEIQNLTLIKLEQ